ncbi:MAG: hypothetical protein AB7P52_11625 [Alphaproteobacteria bacterium]
MDTQPKWIGTSVTVWGAMMAAAGAIWGATDGQVGEATRYGQEALTLLGAVIAFVGRLRANRPTTILPEQR